MINPCAKYAYVDVKGKAYGKWFDGCKSVCIECISGYYLVKGVCVTLPPNCEAVDIKGKCTDCSEGYGLSDGKCIVMTPPEDNCAKYGYIDVKGKWFHKWVTGCKKVCKECVEGYYLNVDYECVALPRYCTDADENGICTECEEGYKLKNGKCVKIIVTFPPPVVDNCLEYKYVDAKGKHYTKWIYGCKKVCVLCKKGYDLVDGKCVPCEEDSGNVGNDNPYCVERNE